VQCEELGRVEGALGDFVERLQVCVGHGQRRAGGLLLLLLGWGVAVRGGERGQAGGVCG
jgi:hypothetical protein